MAIVSKLNHNEDDSTIVVVEALDQQNATGLLMCFEWTANL